MEEYISMHRDCNIFLTFRKLFWIIINKFIDYKVAIKITEMQINEKGTEKKSEKLLSKIRRSYRQNDVSFFSPFVYTIYVYIYLY